MTATNAELLALAERDLVVSALRTAATQEAENARLREWHPIATAPKDEMFIWAYRRDGKWSVGLAYRNVSGGWSDAYGNPDVPRLATLWSPMPKLPTLTTQEKP